jgi:hypothetical protein
MKKLQEYKGNYFKHPYRPTVEVNNLDLLEIKYSDEGLGLYWKIVELMWINEGKMQYDINIISNRLNRIHKKKKIQDIFENFEFFEFITRDNILYVYDRNIIEIVDKRADVSEEKRKAGIESGKVRKTKSIPIESTIPVENINDFFEQKPKPEIKTTDEYIKKDELREKESIKVKKEKERIELEKRYKANTTLPDCKGDDWLENKKTIKQEFEDILPIEFINQIEIGFAESNVKRFKN